MGKLRYMKIVRSKNPNPKLKLLLSEEHTLTSNIECFALNKSGFDVKQACSVEEMLNILEQEKIDIVMFDYLFQKGLGVKKIIQAKKISLNPKVRFVVSSVLNCEEYRQEIHNNNGDLFLLKPIHKNKMIEELKKVTKIDFRKSPRTKCNIPIKIKNSGHYFHAFLLDISADGIHVIDKDNLINPILGMELEFEFSLPQSDEKLTAKGSVVRFTEEGFGVKFKFFDKNTKLKIAQFVENNSNEMQSSHYYL